MALAAAGTATLAFAKSSVDAGMQFDSSMSQVAATMGYTVDELNTEGSEAAETFAKLSEFAQKMGSETAFSASQAADALNYMALAGYDSETSMEMLPNVLNLAAAGGLGLAEASDMVTDASSALGLSLDETAELVDKMAKASSKSNTSVGQLGEAILNVGGTAKNLAGGTTELSTALGILADNGIKGAEGGTALRNIILALSAPTDQAAKQMEALGLSVYDAEGNMRPLEDIFQDLNGALSTMTQGEQTQVLNELFNKVDLKSANALLATTSERWNELSDAIDNADGAAKAMADVQLDNLAGDVTLFQSALEGAKIAVSDELTPSLRKFVQFGSEALSTLTAAFKEDGLTGVIDALGPIVDQGVALLFEALPKVTEAAIGLLEALVNGIINNLPTLIPAAIEIIMSLVNNIVENLPTLIEGAVELVMALADGIIESLPKLIPAVVKVILIIVEKLTEPSMIMHLIQAAIQIIGAIAQGLIAAIPQIVQAVPTIIMNLIETILRFLPQIAASGLQLIGELALGIAKGAVDVLSAIWDICTSIGESFGERLADAREWGRDMIMNFINGIADRISALWDSLKSIGQGIRDFLGFSEPKEGPLSNFHTYAPDMMELFAKGVRDNKGMLRDTVADAFDFGDMTVESTKQIKAVGGDAAAAGAGAPVPIIVQCVLDGQIISENTTMWQLREARAAG